MPGVFLGLFTCYLCGMTSEPEILWQFRSGALASGGRYVRYNQRLFQIMWDNRQQVCRYDILSADAQPTMHDYLDLEAESTLVPAGFETVVAQPWNSGKQASIRRKDNLCLHTIPEITGLPVAEVLLLIAAERARQSGANAYVLACVIGAYTHTLVMQYGEPVYYRRQRADNEHAVMYYLVAALKDRNIPGEEAVCELMLNEETAFDAYRSFSVYFRYLGKFSFAHLQKLVGEDYPPDPIMLQLLTASIPCA
jgi:hypothetical protein